MPPPVSASPTLRSPGALPASRLLIEVLGLTPERANALILFGAVYVNRRRLAADLVLQEGDYLRVHPEPRRFPVRSVRWAERVLRETADYLIIDKPAGIPVHATCDNAQENVAEQLGRAVGCPVLVTQRLDIAAQGLLVFAKNAAFRARFGEWLETRAVIKQYRAVAAGALPTGEIIHYMKPAERAPRVVSERARVGWKKCVLRVERVRECAKWEATEIELTLGTGRNHQIRAQLAAQGVPILGDELYGSSRPAPPGLGDGEVIALQCCGLEFPGAERVELPAPW